MNTFSKLFSLNKRDKRVGICLEWELPALTKDLEKLASKYNLVTYGQEIAGIEYRKYSDDPSMDLIKDFKEGRIDCFVRGINDDYTFQKKYMTQLQLSRLMRLLIVKDVHDREFCLGPISASEAIDKDDRLNFAIKAVNFLRLIGINPRVAVMSACRIGSINYSQSNKESWEESDYIVSKLKDQLQVDVKNVGIELEKSVGEYDFILPARGIIGNQIYRTLSFLGGGKILGIPAFDIEKPTVCYEDNSRNEFDYECHIRAAQYWSSIKHTFHLTNK